MVRLVGRIAGRGGYPRALTLLEVLAALTILGGAVTMMLHAQAQALEHLHQCRLQLIAQDIGKELKSGWSLDKVDLRTPASGTMPGMEGWSWSRSVQRMDVADGVSAVEVTLRIAYRKREELSATPWTCEYHRLIHHEQS